MARRNIALNIPVLLSLVLVASACEPHKKGLQNRAIASSTTNKEAAIADSVWVGKSDESKSCAKEPGIDLDKMAEELKGAGISILAKKKTHDGKMRIQMCGTDKGTLNGYLISKKDLEKAKQLGFAVTPTAHP